jgi:hypothetical protein
MHDDNEYVLIWDHVGPWDGGRRQVCYTESARALIAPWCRVRDAITPEHARAWLNLHARPNCARADEPGHLRQAARTYVGPGWTLSRVRATCGVTWAKAGLRPRP